MRASTFGDGTSGPQRRAARAVPLTALAVCLLACAVLVVAFVLAGCGGQTGPEETGGQVVVEESGSIDPGDTRDPNHANLPYDAYTFEAKKFDRVRVEVVAEGFTPLLKLVEVSTGADLWEWEEEYSDEDALTYTIAGPGTYEARVYATKDGTGTYQIGVSLND
ncbi:MAG: hypothetical protein V1912_01190 [bacterium]